MVRVSHGGRRWEKGGFGHGPEGEAQARAFADEVDAIEEAEGRRASAAIGSAHPIAELCADWAVTYGPLRSDRTRATDRARVNRLAAFFGTRDARSLTHGDVVAFATRTMENRSPSVAMGCLSTLRRVLNLAVRDGLIARNPVPAIGEVIKSCEAMNDATSRDAWSHDEAAKLLEVARERNPGVAAALQFMFGTGTRRGETLALRWEHVDFARNRVEIRMAMKARGRGVKRTKTGSQRFVPLSPSLESMLLNLQRRRKLARRSSEWVFASPTGKLWAERNFNRAWDKVRDVAQTKGVRPLPLHCTRHSFISWALTAATPTKRVSEWCGGAIHAWICACSSLMWRAARNACRVGSRISCSSICAARSGFSTARMRDTGKLANHA